MTIKDLLDQFAAGQYNNQIREAILPLLGTLLDLFHDNTTAGDVAQHVRDAVDPTLDAEGLPTPAFLEATKKANEPPPTPGASGTTEGSLLS